MTKEQYWTVPPCSYLHGRPTFGPSCAEFVFPGCWHFDNDATSKIDDVLTEHGGLLHVLPLIVHLVFFYEQVGGTFLKLSYSLGLFVGSLVHALKLRVGGGWWWWWPGAF